MAKYILTRPKNAWLDQQQFSSWKYALFYEWNTAQNTPFPSPQLSSSYTNYFFRKEMNKQQYFKSSLFVYKLFFYA